jgi:two-component system NtrC family response regulator
LRKRDDDVILLAKTFLGQYNNEFKTKIKGFSDSAMKAMLQHLWPGNIRELKNKLKSAVIMAEGNQIQTDDLGLSYQDNELSLETLNLREVREHAESRAIRNACQVAEKKMSRTAELLV